jgi:arylsulfatase A-like enzyme
VDAVLEIKSVILKEVIEKEPKYAMNKLFALLFLGLMVMEEATAKMVSLGSKQVKGIPNIIFIMSDDHAYQDISAYDDRLIQTPNIDRIAKNGILFYNACVTNSICAPSRATILTGKHSPLNSKTDNHFPFDTTMVTFPQLLKANGYQTAMFGKLHFGNNPKGFDQFNILPGRGVYYNPTFITKNEGTIEVEGYVTDLITHFTLGWLENERKDEEPFFLVYLHLL